MFSPFTQTQLLTELISGKPDLETKGIFLVVAGEKSAMMVNTRDRHIREVQIIDAERGYVVVANVNNDYLVPFLKRMGFPSEMKWWLSPMPHWAFQDELDNDDRVVGAARKVYFIRNLSQNTIKIGMSRNPEARLRSLQTASSEQLELMGFISGDRQRESELHSLLAEHRHAGEWFEFNDVVSSTIQGLLNE